MANRHLYSWEPGQLMHRIHNVQFGSTQFNGSGKGRARFSPLVKPDGTVIPTLYGAGTFRAAAMETVFHDLPEDTVNTIFRYSQLAHSVCSVIVPVRPLNLLDLGTVGLRALKLKKSEVIETSPVMYPATQGLALAWHEQFDDIDGLVWMSRLDDHAPACILFGDRVTASELVVYTLARSLQAVPQLQMVVALAKLLGVTQLRYFPSSLTGF